MADKRTRWIIEATSNIPDVNKQLERLIQLQQTQNELTQQNTTSTALAIQRQREQIEQMANAQSKANTAGVAGGKQQADMIGTLRKEYDLLSKQLSGIVNLAAGAWAVGQLKAYVMEVIAAKSAQDGFVASMEQMLGSRLKAEELNAKLIAIALKSPFEIEQLQEVTKKLQGMGVETEKLIPYINMLGDIAAIVGTQKLPLIAKALTDVQSKHVLMAQEIKQFTDNGVPLYDLLAKSMQKPVEEIRKLASEHKLVFEDVEKALITATQKGGIYYGQMAAQAEQLGGKVANLGDLYTQAKAKIGDYFENGLRQGIKTTGEFIQATIGSENAITRTLTALKAALAVWISYRTAVISVEAAKRANNVTSLAGLATIEASTVATVGLSGVTVSLSGALNGLKVAFMSNPFGFVLTAVTSLISVFYAFKASTIEVAEAQSIEAEALRKTNQEITNSIERVKGLTIGTAERKKATEDLIAKYPELFKNLNAEAIGNAQLETVLKRVNAQYREKIQLAILDAKNNVLLEKQIDLETQRYNIIKKLREENGEISLKFADDSKFIAELNRRMGIIQSSVQSSMTGVNLGAGNMSDGGATAQMIANAKLLEFETKKVQSEITKNANEQSGIRVKIDSSEQNQKLTELRRQLRNHEISLDEFNKKAEALNKESVDKVVKKVEEGEDKKKKAKKATLELSLENDVRELKSMEQTFAVRMTLLNKQEALAIEQTKRTVTDKEQAQDRILSIEREYANKRGALALEWAEKEMMAATKWFEATIEAHKTKNIKLRALREAESFDIKKYNEEVIALADKVKDQEAQNYEQQLEMNKFYRAEVAKNEAKFWQDREIVALEAIKKESDAQLAAWGEQKTQLESHATAISGSVLKQKEYQDVLLQISVLKNKMTKEEQENYQIEAEIMAKRIAQAQMYMQIAMDFIGKMSGQGTDTYGIHIENAVAAVDKLYTYAMEANKKSFDYQIQNSKLSLEAMTGVWDQYAERQRALMDSKNGFDMAATSMNQVLENMKAVDQDMNNFTKLLSEGKWLGAVVSAVTGIFTTKKRLAEDEKELQRQEMENKLAQYDHEIALLDDLLVAQKKATQDYYDDKMDKINKEIEAEQAKYAKLTEEAQAFYTANQNRLKEDDVFRQQMVQAGEARAVATLEKQKQLLIEEVQANKDSALTKEQIADEVARITNAFNKLIADTHKDYQEAMGDKTKEIGKANEEVKAQEVDKVAELQGNLQDVLDGLKNALYDAQVDMANATIVVANNVAQQQIRIESDKWEAMKQYAIQELKMAAKVALGKGDAKGHATAMNQAIEVEQMQNPWTALIGPTTVHAPSIPRSTRPRTDRPGETPGGNGEHGTGTGNPTGPSTRPLFHGDPYVQLRGNADGIDTIPANLHKGERIVQSYLNQFLGPKIGNEELVHGYLQYANLMDRLPNTAVPEIPQMILPDFALNNQNVVSMDRVERKLDELNKTFASKSLIQVNIDGNAVSISEQWESHKATYYDTLFKQ
ncbi:tape measure protein [Dyadobacter sp. CY347]|uniref:tape measure protein n=1 Tax=Dyadobacter sp. CY347 TaxID=2909336 RepID=UPI001F24F523|nr:tape measure protein [Dyadobacter sp. CY347]MCF2487459.1 tape measure protein [Dyadobacter sp. CY347]